MALGKKTIRLINAILHDPAKRKLYSAEEIAYMERQVVLLEKARKRRIKQRKRNKGFS